MARFLFSNKRYSIGLHQVHPLTKAAAASAIILSSITLIALSATFQNAQDRLKVLETNAALIKKENSELADRVEHIDHIDTIRKIASEELNLVDPDTIIIEHTN